MCGRNAADFKPSRFDIKWLEKLDPIADYVEEATFMGWGEPTMHSRFVDFLKWADEKKLRKYFCTNGMKLAELLPAIFDFNVDVIAISIDAADPNLNNEIRRGSDLDSIVSSLKAIIAEKKKRNAQYPYMNFVTTLMKQNIHEFPKIVQLAADIGLDEAKAVFLTVFDGAMAGESLYNSISEVKDVFEEASKISEGTGVKIKLPYLPGKDIAGDASHKPCYSAWRDFFLGSDGYVRPCMSTPLKLFPIDKYDTFEEMWNSREMQDFRKVVNDEAAMPDSCKRCYQSSFANWNKKSSWFQAGEDFAPEWGSSVI
jgi:radical SAM protein with 4Fe4S-binding SPASM domain